MTDDNGQNAYEEFSRKLWSEKVSAPAPVFEALLADHHETTMKAIRALEDKSEDALFEILGTAMMNGESDWYVEPSKKTYAALGKLSKGFALAATDMVSFFPDAYIGEDIRNVLTAPDQPEAEYPSRMLFSAIHFLSIAANYLPEEFWQSSEDLQNGKLAMSFVGDFPYNACAAETTYLACLCEAQTYARVMPVVAEELKENGHANLATIAQCFATKAQVMADDIIARVELALANGQKIDLGARQTGDAENPNPAQPKP